MGARSGNEDPKKWQNLNVLILDRTRRDSCVKLTRIYGEAKERTLFTSSVQNPQVFDCPSKNVSLLLIQGRHLFTWEFYVQFSERKCEITMPFLHLLFFKRL